MFDVMIERQQILKVKVRKVEHLEDGSILNHDTFFLYISLGTRLSSRQNRTYHYDIQILEFQDYFGIHTRFSGAIAFDGIPEMIRETLKEYSKSLNEDIEIVATNYSFTVVDLLNIIGA